MPFICIWKAVFSALCFVRFGFGWPEGLLCSLCRRCHRIQCLCAERECRRFLLWGYEYNDEDVRWCSDVWTTWIRGLCLFLYDCFAFAAGGIVAYFDVGFDMCHRLMCVCVCMCARLIWDCFMPAHLWSSPFNPPSPPALPTLFSYWSENIAEFNCSILKINAVAIPTERSVGSRCEFLVFFVDIFKSDGISVLNYIIRMRFKLSRRICFSMQTYTHSQLCIRMVGIGIEFPMVFVVFGHTMKS